MSAVLLVQASMLEERLTNEGYVQYHAKRWSVIAVKVTVVSEAKREEERERKKSRRERSRSERKGTERAGSQ
jgi:hypothetical protein